jgi:tetratricopeptide (TPR) repeat protein
MFHSRTPQKFVSSQFYASAGWFTLSLTGDYPQTTRGFRPRLSITTSLGDENIHHHEAEIPLDRLTGRAQFRIRKPVEDASWRSVSSRVLWWSIMNDNESILAELHKIGAWADMQRKISKWSLVVVAIAIPILIIVGIVMENRFQASMGEFQLPEKAAESTWSDVDWNIRRANLDEAIRIGEELIQRMPQYSEGHRRLATAYLAAGKTAQAKQHYAEAYRLFPSEENEKLVAAIDRRIKEQNSRPMEARDSTRLMGSETNQSSPGARLLR